ncbi:ankyrin repeat domain-containing protein [Agrobacterium rhizogenes]|nr:ankyrin repeat domain-containing protein [Rhizobium rhizogenes]
MSNDIGDEMQDAFVVEDFDMMKKLILAGSSPNSADRRDGSPIILRAAVTRDLDMINFLIGQQADVDSRGPKGLTALHAAALYGFVEILQRLIEAGSDTNAKDAEGATPLSLPSPVKIKAQRLGWRKY